MKLLVFVPVKSLVEIWEAPCWELSTYSTLPTCLHHPVLLTDSSQSFLCSAVGAAKAFPACAAYFMGAIDTHYISTISIEKPMMNQQHIL